MGRETQRSLTPRLRRALPPAVQHDPAGETRDMTDGHARQTALVRALQERIVVLDGGMGTEIAGTKSSGCVLARPYT